DEGIDDQLHLALGRPLADAMRSWQLFEVDATLIESNPSRHREHVPIEFRHRIERVHDGACHKDLRRALLGVVRYIGVCAVHLREDAREALSNALLRRTRGPKAPDYVGAVLPLSDEVGDGGEGL